VLVDYAAIDASMADSLRSFEGMLASLCRPTMVDMHAEAARAALSTMTATVPAAPGPTQTDVADFMPGSMPLAEDTAAPASPKTGQADAAEWMLESMRLFENEQN
jgi:hypothetical protein